MIITVTKREIKQGSSNWDTCPVALAIKKRIDGEVLVSGHFASLLKGKRWASFPLPRKVKDFISKFDGGKKVKPFSFNLNVK